MKFYSPPSGIEASDFELKSGLMSHSSFSTLFQMAVLPFKERSDAYAFVLGGQSESIVTGPVAHEFTHFWYALSPLYFTIDEIKLRAIGRHFDFVGTRTGPIELDLRAQQNFLLWKFVSAVEFLLSPVMEGMACLAEFDASMPTEAEKVTATPVDLLLRKMLGFKFHVKGAAAQAARDILANTSSYPAEEMAQRRKLAHDILSEWDGTGSFDSFALQQTLEAIRADNGRASRKVDLLLTHPLLVTKGRGAHLLGYLVMRGLFQAMQHDAPESSFGFDISAFQHLIRTKIFFDAELVQVLRKHSVDPISDTHDLLCRICAVDVVLHKRLWSILDDSRTEVRSIMSVLESRGSGLGLPQRRTSDPFAPRTFSTLLESETYAKASEAAFSVVTSPHSGVATRVGALWARRTALLTGRVQAAMSNLPKSTSGAGALHVHSSFDGEPTAHFVSADPLPLPKLTTSNKQIDLFGYIELDDEGPTFLNAFEIDHEPFACAIGIEKSPLKFDRVVAALYVLNGSEAGHFKAIVDSVASIGKATGKLNEIEAKVDEGIVQMTSNIYLDRAISLGPIGQIYLVHQEASNGWSLGQSSYLSKANVVYTEFGSQVMSLREWSTYIRDSASMTLGFTVEAYQEDFDSWIAPWTYKHDELVSRTRHGRLFWGGKDRVFSIF